MLAVFMQQVSLSKIFKRKADTTWPKMLNTARHVIHLYHKGSVVQKTEGYVGYMQCVFHLLPNLKK